MDFSLRDLRAFAVRNRLDIMFLVRSSNAAWMVNRRGLVARPPVGDSSLAGVEEVLAAADEFLIENGAAPRQRLSREQFVQLMAARASGASGGREKDEE
ncbi:MAG: hypothetical protein HYZ81_00515 [Nitrospinae bacterium]|nr:hypothetical protein [Nitrospinota bacterium]